MPLRSLQVDDDTAHKAKAMAAARDVNFEDQSELLLIRSFVEEVHTAAMLTAGAASAVNYSQKHSTADPLIEARSLMSGYHSNLANRPHRILAEELSYDTVQNMSDLDNALRLGSAQLLEFEIDGGTIGFHRAQPLHIATLVDTWRYAANVALDLVTRLRDELISIFPGEYFSTANQLINILDRTARGIPECCKEDGKIVLPQLAERRRSSRQALLQPAHIRTGTSEFRVFATDISVGGIGLKRMPPLPTGTKVSVKLSCGRSLNGTVTWSHGDSAGIAFDQPLSPMDPLIFG